MVATVSHRFPLINPIESHIINFFEICTLPIGIKLESVYGRSFVKIPHFLLIE